MARPNIIAKQYLDKVSWANEQIEKDKINELGLTYDYCVLNDIGCGMLTAEGLRIEKGSGRNSGYHASINGKYEDPDSKSIILYMLIVYKYGKLIEKYGIKNMKISIRGNQDIYRYMFCISAELDEKTVIKLTGDWVLSWDLIHEFSKEKQFEIASIAHTIKGHPIWPCKMIEGRNTVNQVRKTNISIKETLEVLKKCYKNLFAEKAYNHEINPSFSNLEDAFMDYKEWYLRFNNYEEYVDFWDLKRFENVDITEINIKDVFS